MTNIHFLSGYNQARSFDLYQSHTISRLPSERCRRLPLAIPKAYYDYAGEETTTRVRVQYMRVRRSEKSLRWGSALRPAWWCHDGFAARVAVRVRRTHLCYDGKSQSYYWQRRLTRWASEAGICLGIIEHNSPEPWYPFLVDETRLSVYLSEADAVAFRLRWCEED